MAVKCRCPSKRSRRIRNPSIKWIDLPEILGDRLRRVGGDGSFLIYTGEGWQDRYEKVVVIGSGPHSAGPSGRYVAWKALLAGVRGRRGAPGRWGDLVVAVEQATPDFPPGRRSAWEDEVRRNLSDAGIDMIDSMWTESPTLDHIANYWAAL